MKSVIRANAARLKELRARVRETWARRWESAEAEAAWKAAAAEFHAQYDSLAFPGGLEAGLQGIRRGDQALCETALRYLEDPPYCPRSQYVATDLKRALNKTRLRWDLAERFIRWKERRRAASKRRDTNCA